MDENAFATNKEPETKALTKIYPDDLLSHDKQEKNYKFTEYTVQPDDTLYGIAISFAVKYNHNH